MGTRLGNQSLVGSEPHHVHNKYLFPYTIVFGKESVHARSAILRGRGRREIRLAAAYKQKLLPVELERDCSVGGGRFTTFRLLQSSV